MLHDVIERLHFSSSALIWLKVMQSFNSIVYKINFEFNMNAIVLHSFLSNEGSNTFKNRTAK